MSSVHATSFRVWNDTFVAGKIAERISIDADRPAADFENEVLERFFGKVRVLSFVRVLSIVFQHSFDFFAVWFRLEN